MKTFSQPFEEWLSRNREQMIHCPYQPGSLLISRSSCLKRRETAQTIDLSDVMSGSEFDFAYRTGLARCLHCNVVFLPSRRSGKKAAKAVEPGRKAAVK